MFTDEYSIFRNRVFRFFKPKRTLVRITLGKVFDKLPKGESQNILIAALKLAGVNLTPTENTVPNMKRGEQQADYHIAFYYWLHKTKPGTGVCDDVDEIVFNFIIDYDEYFGSGNTTPSMSKGHPQTTQNECVIAASNEEDTNYLLNIPSVKADEGTWFSPFNETSLPFRSRQPELRQLREFAETDDRLSLWALVGPSGSGKTRLVSHWFKNSDILNDWDFGFIDVGDRESWQKWRPARNTFIVIDNVFSFDEISGQIFKRCLRLENLGILRHKVRILILDRISPEPIEDILQNGSWHEIAYATSGIQNTLKYFHVEHPLHFSDDSNLKVVREIHGKDSLGSDPSKLEESENSEWHRPLFAAIRQKLGSKYDEKSSRFDLIRFLFDTTDRLPWLSNMDHRELVSMISVAATITGGLNKSHATKILSAENGLGVEDIKSIIQSVERVIGVSGTSKIEPISPDLLAENFVLLYLENIISSRNAQDVLLSFCTAFDNINNDHAQTFISFFRGLAYNLCQENYHDPKIQSMWAGLSTFFETASQSSDVTVNLIIHAAIFEVMNYCEISSIDCPLEKFAASVDYFWYWEEVGNAPVIPGNMIIAALIFADIVLIKNWNEENFTRDLYRAIQNIPAILKQDPSISLLCIQHRMQHIITPLIKAGDPIEGDEDFTPLMAAVEIGDLNTVKTLLAYGANPNYASKNTGLTALHFAASNGHKEIAEELLREGANPNIKGTEYGTAAEFAVIDGNMGVFELFLKKNKFKYYIDDKQMHRCLGFAITQNNLPIVRRLHELGANFYTAFQLDSEEVLPARAAIFSEKPETAIYILSQYEIELDAEYPLIIDAADVGLLDVIRFILSKGEDVNVRDKKTGNTPLIQAAISGEYDAVKLLLDHDASAELENLEGNTALACALIEDFNDERQSLSKSRFPIIKILLGSGANPNFKLGGEIGCLDLACLLGGEYVDLLLSKAEVPRKMFDCVALLLQSGNEEVRKCSRDSKKNST